jgi:hypothetical protein
MLLGLRSENGVEALCDQKTTAAITYARNGFAPDDGIHM